MRFERKLAVAQLRKYFPIFLALLIGFFSANAINLAFAHGGNTNLIHGCVKGGLLNNGSLRIIAANGTCNANETPLDWDVAGQPPPGNNGQPFTCPNCRFNDSADLGDRFKGKDLSNSYLPSIVINNADLTGTNFSGAQLTTAVFGENTLTNANFTDANAPSLTITGGSVQNALFVRANLTGSLMTSQNISNANFSQAQVNGSFMVGSNLQNANFSSAQANGLQLANANLQGANFTNTDLFGATGLDSANLTGVTWSNTTCPDGTNSNNNGNTCIGHLTP